MTDTMLTFWPDDLPGQPRGTRTELAARARRIFQVALLDEAGQQIGAFEEEEPEPIWVESFAPDGTAGWALGSQPVSLGLTEGHLGARFARVTARVEQFEEQAGLLIDLAGAGIPQLTIWPDSAALDVPRPILLVAEQFAHPERFWQACAQFTDVLADAVPFGSYLEAGQLGVLGLWWQQTEKGLFGTKYFPETRRMYGDHKRVLRYAKTVRQDAMTIVLIDSPEWAGAGGQLFERPAWASICDFRYAWADMTLHELGHSFGLQDEYTDRGPDRYPYLSSYPNVTDKRNAANCRWHDERKPDIAHDPTQWSDGTPPCAADTVGTFQGALYSSTDYYRPQQNCRMREVTQPFCSICQAEISRRLDQL